MAIKCGSEHLHCGLGKLRAQSVATTRLSNWWHCLGLTRLVCNTVTWSLVARPMLWTWRAIDGQTRWTPVTNAHDWPGTSGVKRCKSLIDTIHWQAWHGNYLPSDKCQSMGYTRALLWSWRRFDGWRDIFPVHRSIYWYRATQVRS